MNIPIKNITDVPTPTANTAYIFVDKSDNNLKIKKQSEIVTYIPGVDTSDATVTVNDVLSPKVFYGKDGKQVGAIPTVTPTKTDTLLSIPSGFLQKPYTLTLENSTDLSFVTATSETILKDYVSVDEYGNQITGTIPTVTPTLEENTFTVSKGYVESDTTLSIKKCSVESENNTVILETGFYTAQTLTIGTAKAAETYIPTTNDQIIDSNLFLIGQQIIKGDTNLISENIIKGKTIFGVDGAANTQETFYKCAEVIEATSGGGYIVSGAGSAKANGTYTWDEADSVYYNENGYSLGLTPGGYYAIMSEPPQAIMYKTATADVTSGWSTHFGASPVPTVTQLVERSASWSGYLANTDEEGNWTYSSDLTTDLTYSTITPEVGKIYNEDATIVINPESGSTDLSFVTATSDKILNGFVGADTDGNPVSGTITVKSSEDVMIIGGTVDVAPGYYNGVSKSIPAGNVSINNNIVTLSEGYVYDESVEVGTAYSGTTIIPGTETQTIATQSYLLGDVVIPGSDTFIEENIKDGVTIWGKTGTYKGEQTTDEELVGMLVNGPSGELMFQKLRFEGTESFVDGDPIAIEGTYLYNLPEDSGESEEPTGELIGWRVTAVDSSKITSSFDVEGMLDYAVGEYKFDQPLVEEENLGYSYTCAGTKTYWFAPGDTMAPEEYPHLPFSANYRFLYLEYNDGSWDITFVGPMDSVICQGSVTLDSPVKYNEIDLRTLELPLTLEPIYASTGETPADYKLQLSGSDYDGVYTMADTSATGYDRVWERTDEWGMRTCIRYYDEYSDWALCTANDNSTSNINNDSDWTPFDGFGSYENPYGNGTSGGGATLTITQ